MRAGPGSCSGKVNNSTRLCVRPFGFEPEVPPVAAILPSAANPATIAPESHQRPDMQEAVRILVRPDDMLETFSELAVNDPDLMRIVLQASVAAPVNVQSAEAVDDELKRPAVTGN